MNELDPHAEFDRRLAEHTWDDASLDGDAQLLEAMIDEAMRVTAVATAGTGIAAVATSSKTWPWLLALGLTLGAGAAWFASQAEPRPEPHSERVTVQEALAPEPDPLPAPALPPLSNEAPSHDSEATPEPQPALDPPMRETTPPRKAPRAKPTPSDPAALLDAADHARRAGDNRGARRLYERLRSEHRGSREELTARVSLAKLELDRLGHPKRALELFDSYLDAQPKGTLAEAALAGRARALGALGRSLEEAAAWQRLLKQIPDTVHRSRAEQRLAQLEP